MRTLLTLILSTALAAGACSNRSDAPKLNELQRVQAGAVEIVLLSPSDAMKQGKDRVFLEFRAGPDRHLVDVGAVKVSATMTMAGMAPMIGGTTVERTETIGRYELMTDLSMSGSWRLGVEWDGPAGHGAVTVPGTVR